MRRGRRKALYRRERDSLEGSHEEARIQRKALRRGRTWPDAVEDDPKKWLEWD